MNEGFFKKGDYIEASGELIGLVTEAGKNTMEVQRISVAPSGTWLMNQKSIFSNLSKDYESKYWIKRLEQPTKPLKSFQVKPII